MAKGAKMKPGGIILNPKEKLKKSQKVSSFLKIERRQKLHDNSIWDEI